MLSNMRMAQGAVECAFPLRVPAFRPQVSMRLRVEALQSGALRVTRTLREEFLPMASDVVIPQQPGELTVAQDDEAIRATAGGITAAIDREYGSITFYDADGRVLLREDQRRPCVLQEKPVLVNTFSGQGEITLRQSVDGVRASADDYETHEVRRAYACKQSFTFAPNEGLYGLGSHEEGYGNLRGKTRELYQHNMKAVVPMLVSTKGWDLLFDLGCLMSFHDDACGS